MKYVALIAMLVACSSSGDDLGDDTTDADAGATAPDAAEGTPARLLCHQPIPEGAQMPPPPPTYSGASCPTLVPGTNTIVSSGAQREFILVVPDDLRPDESLPLGILWHPLASSADVFLTKGELETAINQDRFLAILPEAKGDLSLQWPWLGLDTQARVDEELRFLDDMFACVAQQYNVNLSCVSNGGVSSGGLWAMQVGWQRGQHFSSLLSVSGGSGDGSVVKPWQSSLHKMPVLVLWGGAADMCVVFNFTDTSHTLEQELVDDGHFVVECIHNCGHAIPPFDAPEGQSGFAPLWEFVLNHPYWLRDGESPYLDKMPGNMPAWCGVGMDSATERTGMCADPSQC